MNKRLSVKDLIARKEEIKNKKDETKELYIESLDANIIIRKPDKALCLDAMDMGVKSGDEFLVYNSVVEPRLKDKELQSAYDCVTPSEIVDKIFEIGEISLIAKECISLAGFTDSVKVVDDVKKL